MSLSGFLFDSQFDDLENGALGRVPAVLYEVQMKKSHASFATSEISAARGSRTHGVVQAQWEIWLDAARRDIGCNEPLHDVGMLTGYIP